MTKTKVIASDIIWDIDMDDIYEKLDNMSAKNAAKALGISYKDYVNMSTGERHAYAYDQFHNDPAELYEFLDLPEEIEIPDEISTTGNDENITDWISTEYGYCIEGYALSTD